MTEDNEFISWKWIAGILVGLIILAFGGIIADTRQGVSQAQEKIEKIQAAKVDKEQYRCDIERVEDKLDKLINMHVAASSGNNK